MLSSISSKAYRIDWDPSVQIPKIEGAKYFHTKWAARPLFRIGNNVVRGVRENDRVMLESDYPITFNFDEE